MDHMSWYHLKILIIQISEGTRATMREGSFIWDTDITHAKAMG
nr:MAG TPA: hypothetical protein [Caudoviricetes sp.]